MSQAGARLRRRTGLSPDLAPRALLQLAVPFAASLVAHATVVAALTGHGAARHAFAEPPAAWIEAPETANLEPVAPADAEEGAETAAATRGSQTREPGATSPSDAPPALVDMPPPGATPGAHAGEPLGGQAPAAWWAAAKKVPVGPLDSRDGYDDIRAQVAGWNPKLVTGTYVPGSGIVHPDEMPNRRVPAAVVGSVVRASMNRFHVCHGAGLPQSATISGEVMVTFVIEPDGHVSGPRDAGGTFPDDAVRQCIVSTVAQLSFPDPPTGSPQEVTIRVTLQADESLARPDIRSADPLYLPP